MLKKAVIVDVDDFLIKSEYDSNSDIGFYHGFCELISNARLEDDAFQKNFKKKFATENPKDGLSFYVKELMGLNMETRCAKYNEFFNPSKPFLIEEVIEIDKANNQRFIDKASKNIAFKGVKEFLEKVTSDENIKLFALSSGQDFRINKVFKTLGWDKYFKFGEDGNVICNGDTSKFPLDNKEGKKGALRKISKDYEIPLNHIIYADDGSSSLKAAAQAGVPLNNLLGATYSEKKGVMHRYANTLREDSVKASYGSGNIKIVTQSEGLTKKIYEILDKIDENDKVIKSDNFSAFFKNYGKNR